MLFLFLVYTIRTCALDRNCASCNWLNYCKGCRGGFSQNGRDGYCYPCHKACRTCNNGNKHYCYSCSSNRYKINHNCYCNVGYYQTKSFICNRCHSTCKTCNGGSYRNCLSCSGSRKLKNSICQVSCTPNYYLYSSNVCRPCHSKCYHCQGPSSKQCTKCSGSNLKNKQCVSTCQPFYYTSYNTCIACHSSCYKCSGTKSSQCTQCVNNLKLRNNQCVSSCQPKFYQISKNQCKPCHASCYQCSGSLKNQCVKCNGLSKLRNNICVSSCQPYYYQISNYQCSKCHPTCFKCSSSQINHCIQCSGNLKLRNNFCKSNCQPDYYTSNSNQCSACHKTCFKCLGPLNIQCTQCTGNLKLRNKQCVTNCQPNYYFSEKNACSSCHVSCYKCSGTKQDQCTQCFGILKLKNKQCVLNCQPNYFLSDDKNKCSICHSSCFKCTSTQANHCTQCSGDLKLRNNFCKPNCQPNYFMSSSNQCSACHKTCLKCTGLKENQCIQCLGSLKLRKNFCVQSCQPSYFQISINQCKICHISCYKCSGIQSNQCTQCVGKLTLRNNYCVSQCEPNYYQSESNVCSSCHDSCYKCSASQSNHCTQCANNYFLRNNQCALQCQPNYFISASKQCSTCHKSCFHCSGYRYNQCTRCQGILYLKDNQCINKHSGSSNTRYVCGYEFYGMTNLLGTDNKCIPCHKRCYQCYGQSQNECFSCKDVYWKRTDTDSCVNYDMDNDIYVCGDNQYPIKKSTADGYRICSGCDILCLKCIGPTNMQCSSCNTNIPAYLHLGSQCLKKCPLNYYSQNQNYECRACFDNCTTCFGPKQNQCLSCQGIGVTLIDNVCLCDSVSGYNHKLSDGTCVKSCPQNTYYLNGSRDCVSLCKEDQYYLKRSCYNCPQMGCDITKAIMPIQYIKVMLQQINNLLRIVLQLQRTSANGVNIDQELDLSMVKLYKQQENIKNKMLVQSPQVVISNVKTKTNTKFVMLQIPLTQSINLQQYNRMTVYLTNQGVQYPLQTIKIGYHLNYTFLSIVFKVLSVLMIFATLIIRNYNILYPILQIWQFGYFMLYLKTDISNQFFNVAQGLSYSSFLFYNPFSHIFKYIEISSIMRVSQIWQTSNFIINAGSSIFFLIIIIAVLAIARACLVKYKTILFGIGIQLIKFAAPSFIFLSLIQYSQKNAMTKQQILGFSCSSICLVLLLIVSVYQAINLYYSYKNHIQIKKLNSPKLQQPFEIPNNLNQEIVVLQPLQQEYTQLKTKQQIKLKIANCFQTPSSLLISILMFYSSYTIYLLIVMLVINLGWAALFFFFRDKIFFQVSLFILSQIGLILLFVDDYIGIVVIFPVQILFLTASIVYHVYIEKNQKQTKQFEISKKYQPKQFQPQQVIVKTQNPQKQLQFQEPQKK